jgi:hypothetical protein
MSLNLAALAATNTHPTVNSTIPGPSRGLATPMGSSSFIYMELPMTHHHAEYFGGKTGTSGMYI